MEPATPLDAAVDRVSEERAAVAAERDALDVFLDRVGDLASVRGRVRPDGGVVDAAGGFGGGAGSVGEGTPDELATVREAFVDLVVPVVPDHVESDSPAATMRDELGPEVAGALAGDGAMTSPLRAALRESVAERRRELDATEVVLDREREQLARAREAVTDAVEWLRTADEAPLSELGFEALAGRHERLTDVRERCDALLDGRQSFRRATTGRDGCRVAHEPFFAYLYGETDTPAADYPVLSSVTDLVAVRDDAARAVRAHLVRRG
jgi:hypothetical protein